MSTVFISQVVLFSNPNPVQVSKSANEFLASLPADDVISVTHAVCASVFSILIHYFN